MKMVSIEFKEHALMEGQVVTTLKVKVATGHKKYGQFWEKPMKDVDAEDIALFFQNLVNGRFDREGE